MPNGLKQPIWAIFKDFPTKFATFPRLSHQSGPKWFRKAIWAFLQLFLDFPTKVVWNDLEWAILAISQVFQTEVFWNGLEVQEVPYYDQNWQKLYISVDSQQICTQLSEQGSFFQASRNESKKCYAMIKTDDNWNISADSELICTQLLEQGLFFWASQNEPRSTMLWSKLMKT